MSWPLGYGKPEITYRTRAGGIMLANGVEVTSADGWIDVPSLPSALALGAPVIAALQVRARLDSRGRTYLFAGAVRAEGREYADPHAVNAPWASAWLGSLTEATHAAIARKLQAASRASTVPARRVVALAERGGLYAERATPPQGVDVVPVRREGRGA